MDDLSLIKKRRVVLGITQKELSKLSGVSQSMIAKIEAERAEASYSVACKIFKALDSLASSSERSVEDFMKRKIIFCDVRDKVVDVIKKMRRKDVSQLPVLGDGMLVGLISEKVLIDNVDRLSEVLEVGDIMVDAPPVVSKITSRDTVISLLREFPIILIKSGKDFVGLVCKLDILRKI